MEDLGRNIAILRNLIEESVGRRIQTPADFNFLTGVIQERTHEMLSVTTLKRIWGYIEGYDTTRYSTLNILTRCVGYKDWETFVRNYCASSNAATSRLLFNDYLDAQQIEAGTKVRIAWNPNRECLLLSLGNGFFKVEEAVNSKIRPGDTFHCSIFIKDQPLYLDNLIQPEHASSLFVVGNRGGLTKIEIEQCKSPT